MPNPSLSLPLPYLFTSTLLTSSQCIEADLGSLGASQCANLCVALVRLGHVPGGSWLQRFMVQVGCMCISDQVCVSITAVVGVRGAGAAGARAGGQLAAALHGAGGVHVY